MKEEREAKATGTGSKRTIEMTRSKENAETMRARTRPEKVENWRHSNSCINKSESKYTNPRKYTQIIKIHRWKRRQQWVPKNIWKVRRRKYKKLAMYLSKLLTGKARETYSWLSSEQAHDCEVLKSKLFLRYGLSGYGYNKKFRNFKPEASESSRQFVERFGSYLKNGNGSRKRKQKSL